MNENALTQKVIMSILSAGGTELTRRFLQRVVGVEVKPAEAGYQYRTEALWEDFGHAAVLVVGVAPEPGLSSDDRRLAPGSRVDAVIAGDVAVAFEFKVAGQCQRSQLVRHARHWAIECADDALSNEHMLPPGFALRGWGDVWRWLAEELEEPVGDPREETLLLGLQSTLAGMGSALGVSRQPASSSLPPTPAAVGHPRPTPSREMAQGYDLAAVYRAVSRLYGKNGDHRVASSDCREDVALMRSAFEDAGTEIPRGLSGNVMTPRRVLTVLYSGEGLSDATPASWTDLRMRVLERGGDRGTLVAMLGWAAAHPNTEASRRLYRTTARVWGETPDTLPGMPELHAALSRTRG